MLPSLARRPPARDSLAVNGAGADVPALDEIENCRLSGNLPCLGAMPAGFAAMEPVLWEANPRIAVSGKGRAARSGEQTACPCGYPHYGRTLLTRLQRKRRCRSEGGINA